MTYYKKQTHVKYMNHWPIGPWVNPPTPMPYLPLAPICENDTTPKLGVNKNCKLIRMQHLVPLLLIVICYIHHPSDFCKENDSFSY